MSEDVIESLLAFEPFLTHVEIADDLTHVIEALGLRALGAATSGRSDGDVGDTKAAVDEKMVNCGISSVKNAVDAVSNDMNSVAAVIAADSGAAASLTYSTAPRTTKSVAGAVNDVDNTAASENAE